MRIFAKTLLAACAIGALAASAAEAQPFRHHGGAFRHGYHGGFGYGPGWAFPPLILGVPPYYGPAYDGWRHDRYLPPPPPPEYYGDDGERPWHMTRKPRETDYELPDSVLFAFDSAQISPQADAIIGRIAQEAARQDDSTVVVEGYTDTHGAAAYNKRLSYARARAVAGVLEKHGVAGSRVRTEGFGETHLAVQTGDEVREVKNRRVVIRIMDGEGRQDAHQRDNDGQPDVRRQDDDRDDGNDRDNR